MYRATGYSSPLKVTFGQFSNRPLWNMYEMACEIAGGLKYFMVFQLGSKPIVFHLEFHEIKLRGKAQPKVLRHLLMGNQIISINLISKRLASQQKVSLKFLT